MKMQSTTSTRRHVGKIGSHHGIGLKCDAGWVLDDVLRYAPNGDLGQSPDFQNCWGVEVDMIFIDFHVLFSVFVWF